MKGSNLRAASKLFFLAISVLLLTSSPAAAQTLWLADNFDGCAFSSLWPTAGFDSALYTANGQEKWTTMSGRGCTVHYYVPSGVDEVTPAQMGVSDSSQMQRVTGQTSISEFYLEWSEYFPANHNFADIGQKLSRFIYWRDGETKGAEMTFAVLNNNSRTQIFLYHPTGKTDGTALDLGLDGPPIAVGKWVRVGLWMKLNTPGRSDGFVHLYMDGQETIGRTNMSIRGNDNRGFNIMWIGGNHSNNSRPTTEAAHRYIDDVKWYSSKPSTTATPTPTATASPSATNTATPVPTSTVSGKAVRIRAGGTSYTDSLGRTWLADTYFSGGQTHATSTAISGTNDPALYQTERYGHVYYNIPVSAGSYKVTLRFAEIYFTAAGQRVFDVLAEGSSVLSKLDVIAKAGGPNRAYDYSFTRQVSDGTLNLELRPVVENPKIASIEVEQVLTSTPTPTVSATATPVPTVSSTSTPTPSSTPVPSASSTPVPTSTVPAVKATRINAGGRAYTDSLGRNWLADSYYSGGDSYGTDAGINGTNDPALYQTERFGSVVYNIPVAAGAYKVTLRFAEIYFSAAGERVFDVLAEGSPVLSSLDIIAKTGGGNRAFNHSFVKQVSDGAMTLELRQVVENPKISAIEVEPVLVTVSPDSINFGTVTVSKTSVAQAISVANTSGTTAAISSVGVFGPDAASFRVNAQFPLSIPAGTTASIPMTFVPAHEGAHTATAEVVLSSPVQQNSVSLSGSGAMAPSGGTPVKLINSGGSAFTDSRGLAWAADSSFSGGGKRTTSKNISGTTDQALYRSERNGNNFGYNVALPNATYDVTLHFADFIYTAAGKRLFDVYAEGQSVITNLDIVAAVGPLAPLTRTITVPLSDGVLNLRFVGVVNGAKVSGIEVRQSGATPPAARSCSSTVVNNPATIFCDDFEGTDPVGSRYFEYNDNGGDFVPVSGKGVGGSRGMRVVWQAGEADAGSIKRAFGRIPAGLGYASQSNTGQDFREICWRIYVRNEIGWSGYPDKLSRAMSFGSESSWAQAMIAHVWSSTSSPVLVIDPASGVNSSGQLATKSYNDFANLSWLGSQSGSTPIYTPEDAGNWHCIEAHVKLNTPGRADGVFELWIDDKAEAARTGLNWVGTWQDYGINSVFIENYWNDGAPAQRTRYLDNFMISTQRIGCGG